jgi:hypothetical protein
MRRFIGLIIGAGFGTLFILINSGPPLEPTVTLVLRVLAVLGFVALVVGTVLIGRPSSSPDSRSGVDPEPATGLQMDQFGTRYWIVVAAEVVLLFGGFQVLRRLEAPAQTGVAWVAVVVGVHFIAFLWVWKQRSILIPGVLLTGYGVVGLIMATTSAVAWVPVVSGVLSGVTLLAGSLLVLGSRRDLAQPRP